MILHDEVLGKEMSLHLSMLWSSRLFLLGGETVCTTGPLTMFACYEDERQLWMLWGYENASVVLCVMGSWRKQMYFAASQSFNIDLSRMFLDMHVSGQTHAVAAAMLQVHHFHFLCCLWTDRRLMSGERQSTWKNSLCFTFKHIEDRC